MQNIGMALHRRPRGFQNQSDPSWSAASRRQQPSLSATYTAKPRARSFGPAHTGGVVPNGGYSGGANGYARAAPAQHSQGHGNRGWRSSASARPHTGSGSASRLSYTMPRRRDEKAFIAPRPVPRGVDSAGSYGGPSRKFKPPASSHLSHPVGSYESMPARVRSAGPSPSAPRRGRAYGASPRDYYEYRQPEHDYRSGHARVPSRSGSRGGGSRGGSRTHLVADRSRIEYSTPTDVPPISGRWTPRELTSSGGDMRAMPRGSTPRGSTPRGSTPRDATPQGTPRDPRSRRASRQQHQQQQQHRRVQHRQQQQYQQQQQHPSDRPGALQPLNGRDALRSRTPGRNYGSQRRLRNKAPGPRTPSSGRRALQKRVRFAPGSLGITFRGTTITDVSDGSQAHMLGVHTDWNIVSVGGKAVWTEKQICDELDTQAEARRSYVVVFSMAAGTAEAARPSPRLAAPDWSRTHETPVSPQPPQKVNKKPLDRNERPLKPLGSRRKKAAPAEAEHNSRPGDMKLVECKYCLRNFSIDRIERHQTICSKLKNARKKMNKGALGKKKTDKLGRRVRVNG